ncbi:carbohydrate binding domain-containing protein [Streptomyces sp. 6N223]|uniref:carbohydrate binding domain-containing protein n=1 Tax=Streptomyces sp. 6N223 TaxID=3457412 RepID=UPI003FD49E3C
MRSGHWRPLPEKLPAAARELAEHLRTMLDESGISLRQLAGTKDVHYSLTSLHRFFAGRALPPRQLVELLGSRYGRDDAARERLMLLYERAAASASASDSTPAPAAAEQAERQEPPEHEKAREKEREPEPEPPPAAPEPEPPSPAGTGRRRLIIPGALVLLAGTLAGAGAAVGTGLLGGSSREPGEPSDVELLRNGGFDTGRVHPWWPHGEVEPRIQQGALRVGVRGGTEQPWDAMVGHSGVGLREGVSYTLRFTAWASVAAEMFVTVLREEQPRQPLVEVRTWPVHLGTAPQKFSFGFESILTSDFGQVTFRFGGGKDSFTAFLDDVSLTPTPGSARR